MPRYDMSDWVIHFVHDRNPKNEAILYSDKAEEFILPYHFNHIKNNRHDFWNIIDEEYPMKGDAHAISVLIKILTDGHIRSTWSFRNYMPTIYGPCAAVCFTEMPLYALLEYAKSRSNSDLVTPYCIAFPKRELFLAGGRPVIYGVSGRHREKTSELKWPRLLADSCGIAPSEQYRYVALNLDRDSPIDWTHEREWRWADTEDGCEFPGFPIWMEEKTFSISNVLIVVRFEKEVETILDKIKELYDSKNSNYDMKYDRRALANTKVVSIEKALEPYDSEKDLITLDSLPTKQLQHFKTPEVSASLLEKVEIALCEAEKVAEKAAEEWEKNASRNEDGHILGPFGFASLMTGDSQSSFVQALIKLDAVHIYSGIGYEIKNMSKGNTLLLDQREAAVDAAINVLNNHFPEVYFWARLQLD